MIDDEAALDKVFRLQLNSFLFLVQYFWGMDLLHMPHIAQAFVFFKNGLDIRANGHDFAVLFAGKGHGGMQKLAGNALPFVGIYHAGMVNGQRGGICPHVA